MPEIFDPNAPEPAQAEIEVVNVAAAEDEDKTITLTENAANQINLLTEDEDSVVALRVFVQGGGCSGFQYGFAFETFLAEDDTIVSFAAATIVIDPLSLPFIEGSTIDYVETIMSSQFTIDNPNTSTACGCGSSFSM